MAASRQEARALWGIESAKERDRLLVLPVADRLVAMDDEGVRAALTPEHRAEVRTSIAASVGVGQQGDQQHQTDLEAWRARDTAQRAATARLERDRAIAAWGWCRPLRGCRWCCLPQSMAGPRDVLATLGAASWLPLVPLGICAAALAGAGLCGWLAKRAGHVSALRWSVAGAALAGLVLLGASRSLPLFRASPGTLASDERSLGGSVILLRAAEGGTRLDVLTGNGKFAAGERLFFPGGDPAGFLQGKR